MPAMSDPRYAPPTVDVVDRSGGTRGPVPGAARLAIRLLWLRLPLVALSLVMFAVNFGNVAAVVITFAIELLITLRVAAGGNWARLLFAGWVAMAVLSQADTPVPAFNPVVRPLTVALFALDFAALYLLFTRTARVWFRPPG